MLCRTASDLYWASRHIERVDNTARLVDLTLRIAMLPDSLERGRAESAAWLRALDALGLEQEYLSRIGEVDQASVIRFLLFDPVNPSSIRSALGQARESGRAQRTAITAEMYEGLNTTWLEMRDLAWEDVARDGLSDFLDWLKRRSASFRGVTLATMIRDEGYEFLRLGTFVERADFGVRLLDIQFGEHGSDAGADSASAAEYYQLSALLHAISALETFRRIYRDTITPRRVAELAVLRPEMPRSLAVCAAAIHDVLATLSGGERNEAVRLAGALAAELRYARIEDMVDAGMQRWLAGFLDRLYGLSEAFTDRFLLSTDVVAS